MAGLDPRRRCLEHDAYFPECCKLHTRSGHSAVIAYCEQARPGIRPYSDRLASHFGGHRDAWFFFAFDAEPRFVRQLLDIVEDYDNDIGARGVEGMLDWLRLEIGGER